MRPFDHIFFDLDHTLWDFERSSRETLQELFLAYDLENKIGHPFEDFITAFYKVNYHLWSLYDRNAVNKEEIRVQRFPLIFKELGISYPALAAEKLSDEYLHGCPRKPHTIDYAKEILEYLSPNYTMHILTNGFEDIQATKLKSAQLDHFFDVVVTSECTGHKKPAPQIFAFALHKSKATLERSIMIGDSLATDIAGAVNIGMPCVFYNPEGKEHSETLHAEIKSLRELHDLL